MMQKLCSVICSYICVAVEIVLSVISSNERWDWGADRALIKRVCVRERERERI